MIRVLKASGEYEPFSEEKIRNSLFRSGLNEEIVSKIVSKLKEKIYDGISTHKIHSLISDWLAQEKFYFPSRYQLKRAIAQLGPSGYPFEKFFAGILRHLDYKTLINQILKGKCVNHEIDVIAEKDGKKILVECKFHHRSGLKTNIKTALYVWARFLDLKDEQNFDQAWLVTNTKLTTQAIKYSQCIGMKLISWNYRNEWSLRELIEDSRLYPVTLLSSLSKNEKQRLLGQGIVFCRDLKINLNLVSKNKRERLKQELRFVFES